MNNMDDDNGMNEDLYIFLFKYTYKKNFFWILFLGKVAATPPLTSKQNKLHTYFYVFFIISDE